MMVLVKKIGVVLVLLLVALVGFGYLPKEVSNRITRFLAILLVVGFVVRVGAYLWG